MLDWLRARFDVRGTAPNVYVCCPFCEEGGKSRDEGYHMSVCVLEERPVAHCFRCDWKGTHAGLVMGVDSVNFRDAVAVARGAGVGRRLTPAPRRKPYDPFGRERQADIAALKRSPQGGRGDEAELPEEFRPLDPKRPRHRAAWEYLESRGVSKMIQPFEIGFCVLGDYAQRLIFPVRFRGRLVGFTARSLTGAKPKYRHSEGFAASEHLYNYDIARKSDRVVLVEGVFDVFPMAMRAVALFGKNLSASQLRLIVSTWPKATVMLDPDASESAWKICRRLKQFVQCDMAVLPWSKDPGEAPQDEIKMALANPAGIAGLLERRKR